MMLIAHPWEQLVRKNVAEKKSSRVGRGWIKDGEELFDCLMASRKTKDSKNQHKCEGQP